jgi:6-phosphofructokinase 1
MLKGNAIIGQSGGPTSVINASLVGIVDAVKNFNSIETVMGMRYGIEGFMQDDIINLSKESQENLDLLRKTPSSALGSCRHKLTEEDLPVILGRLKEYNIRYVFMIGGNDTMDTIHRLEEYAANQGYELVGIGVPKTVDNDLFGTDHTPGFASAARFNAYSVRHSGFLFRDMKKVDQFVIYQTIGREAGWLVGAAAAGKQNEDEAPHILCMPERPFVKEKFLADVKACYDKYGWVSIVCGEGITFEDGTPVSASQTKDKFSNVEFGAMGGTSAAMSLHKMIAEEFGFRGEFQITESLPMCAGDRAEEQDLLEAYMAGQAAVNLAEEGKTGLMVSLVRSSNAPYRCITGEVPLKDVAVRAKPMPDEYINEEGNFITPAFMEYIRPLMSDFEPLAMTGNHPV